MKLKPLLVIFLWFNAMVLLAQVSPRIIKGKITDETGNPLEGVSVLLRNTKSGTTTGDNGTFVLKTTATGKLTLTISSTGFMPQTITTEGVEPISIKLIKSFERIEDVVVIGYQTVKRRDLVAPVSSLSAKDLKDIPITSAEQALTGRLAGVQVITSEGSPDASVKIVVRGGMSITQDNTPLYIVDGVPIDNALQSIPPQDIQTIDVLKDASATAIYGARGANGVILITTKLGKPGTKMSVSYNGSVGIKNLTKELPVLHPYDFVQFQYERSRWGRYINNINTTTENNFSTSWGSTYDTLENYKNVPFTDWQHLVMDNSGVIQTHNIGINGGTKKLLYNLSLTDNSNDDIILNTGLYRKSANLRLEYNPIKKLKIGVEGRYTDQTIRGAGTADAGSTVYNRLRNAVRYKPILKPGETTDYYDEDYYDETNNSSLVLINPIILNQQEFRRRYTKTANITAFASWAIDPHWTFKTTYGYTQTNYLENFFEDSATTDVRLNGAGGTAILQTTAQNIYSTTNSNTISFKYKFKRHHSLDGVLGEELTVLRTNGLQNRLNYVGATTVPTLENTISGQLQGKPFASYPIPQDFEAKQLSFFGRVNYTYNGKYLLSLTLRDDGSSKFAQDNRWGLFNSVSVGWRLSQEKFMQSITNVVSDLKVRAGYGTTGNNKIANYLYLSQFYNTAVYGLSNSSSLGYYPYNLANQYLTWETNVTRNIGFDAAFFKNKISLSFDVYKNTAKNLLISAPVPTTSGYTTQLQNIGAATNKGIEIALGATIIKNKNFVWGANFNISFNKNVIDRLAVNQNSYLDNSGALTGQTADYIVKVGQPVGAMYGYVTDGIYMPKDFTATYNNTAGVYTYALNSNVPSDGGIIGTVYPGVLKLKDINGDGVVDANDRTIIGNAQPKFTGGLNQTFQYKNFDASVFLNFVYGNKILNANKIEFTNAFTADINVLSIMKDRYKYIDPSSGAVITDPNTLTTMNTNAKIWIPSQTTGAGAFVLHSWAIEDGSFLRVNNITIGYSINSAALKKIKISKLRLYLTGNNIAKLTGYSGYDPEVNSRRTTQTTPGVDYSAYPRSRTFVFGVQVSF